MAEGKCFGMEEEFAALDFHSSGFKSGLSERWKHDKTEYPAGSPYTRCELCPRRCQANRLTAPGFCGETSELRIASASIHRGEEPPITGAGGSGTIFITGCTLGCVFCQNWQISRTGMGRLVSAGEFAALCLSLEGKGAENINLVTGSHAIPALAEGIRLARKQGLSVPVLWNSSAYENVEALSLLADTVDVYLPDLKTLDSAISRRFFMAPDYPERAAAAILKMLESRGTLKYGSPSAPESPGPSDRTLISGTVIRHLILPGHLDATREVIRWFADHAQGRALLSLMTQYTPLWGMKPEGEGGPPGRFLNREEYERVCAWLDEFGIEEGFYQELSPDSEWLPDFNRINPFSSELSVPVWHWREGPIQESRV
jgi:putative pyruvate formate lyase activating enzyme